MKTIRQRKDELLTTIRVAKKVTPIIDTRPSLFEEYKKILTRNGFKNMELVDAQINRMLDLKLPKEAIYSNLKFMNLFRSRLSEEGIPLADAEIILQHVSFNMIGINEDDDYIGDVALEYAEVCKIFYDAYVVHGGKLLKDIADTFNMVELQLPPAE